MHIPEIAYREDSIIPEAIKTAGINDISLFFLMEDYYV